MHLRHGDRKYDFSDLDEATDAEVELEIAEIRQGADRLTREAEIQALMKSRLGSVVCRGDDTTRQNKFRSTLPRRERPRFPNWLRRQRKVSYLRESTQIAGAEAVDGSIGKENIIFSNLL
jgi:hypothetical protein